jgi:hypothetical protein
MQIAYFLQLSMFYFLAYYTKSFRNLLASKNPQLYRNDF